jgi:hypothetical protein
LESPIEESDVSDVDSQEVKAAAAEAAEAEAHEAAVEEATLPEDDDKAADLFYLLESRNWVTLKPDYKPIFHNEETHLWIIGSSDKSIKSIAYKLSKKHIEPMGRYGRFNNHANKVIERLGSYNVVEEDWAIDFDHLDGGLVPFNSCIINMATALS